MSEGVHLRPLPWQCLFLMAGVRPVSSDFESAYCPLDILPPFSGMGWGMEKENSAHSPSELRAWIWP